MDLQRFSHIAFPARIAKLCVDAGKLWDREVGDRPRDNTAKMGETILQFWVRALGQQF